MKKILGYFIDSGDQEIGDLFVRCHNKYDYYFLEPFFRDKKYGNDLDLILIQYHLSGKFRDWDQIHPRVLNYSSKEKAIGVIVGVRKEDFLALSHQQKKQFFVDTTRQAVLDVRERLEKKKLDVDFDSLLKDLGEVNEKYLNSDE